MSEEKTLSQLLNEYNAMGNDAMKAHGMPFRDRVSFKDHGDATRSFEKLQTAIKGVAAQEAQEPAAPGIVQEVKKPKAKKASKTMAKTKSVKSKKVAVGNGRGRKSVFAPEQKISVVEKENPRRAGTEMHKQYELARKSKTVGDYTAAGGKTGPLGHAVKRGWLRVS